MNTENENMAIYLSVDDFNKLPYSIQKLIENQKDIPDDYVDFINEIVDEILYNPK